MRTQRWGCVQSASKRDPDVTWPASQADWVAEDLPAAAADHFRPAMHDHDVIPSRRDGEGPHNRWSDAMQASRVTTMRGILPDDRAFRSVIGRPAQC